MITVKLNEPNFEYDIHSLVKAFYPGEDVYVSDRDCRKTDPVSFRMTVTYEHADEDASQEFPGSIRFAFHAGASGEETELSGSTAVNFSDRKETKNRLKQKLYELLCAYSGRTLPWGTLTGIRPTKIPLQMMEEGRSEARIRSYMKEKYFASEEKIGLAIEVARKEEELLADMDYANGYSLYIGIPFCPTTCAYCSFTSYPMTRWADQVDRYLDCLEKEMDFTAQAVTGHHLDTIYIGGGTPTTLTPEQSDRLLAKIEQTFDLSHVREFCVEGGRPDSITREKLAVLKQHSVTRISINPQTMKQETLDLIGRRHTVQQTREAFALAREMGFDDINMDLIVGLPGETIDDVRATMEEMKAMKPDNLTVHSLAIKRAARLRIQEEDYRGFRSDNTWETIRLTADACREMGLEPYYLYRQKNMAGNFENVGYARRGCEGLYNILIMEEKQTIMALGAGASTKFVLPNTAQVRRQTGAAARIERVENVKDITNYLERIDEMIERKRRKMEELGWH